MNDATPIDRSQPDTNGVRADFIPADHYTSREFLRLEGEHVWPKVWQIACREQDLREPGAFHVVDIMRDSVVIVRGTDGALRAFHNVCSHRGRRLVSGSGETGEFHCGFHGWRYDLDGKVKFVLDREDWQGCPDFTDQDLSLKSVQVDNWGGWVFINMDPEAERLRDFLAPLPEYLDCFELETMSYRWHATVKVPCNWKVALEAFNEAYHVSATHSQQLPFYGDDKTSNAIFGKHAKFYYEPNPDYPVGAPSPRLGREVPEDLRANIVEYFDQWNRELGAFFAERDVEAARRVLTEVPEGANAFEIMGAAMQFMAEAAIAGGVGWPDLTMEQIGNAMTDWHVFPNHIFLPWPSGILGYRALPHPSDPDVCFFDVYALQRYAPGFDQPYERHEFMGDEDWREFKKLSIILAQDIDNMMDVQRGMHSRAFKGARTNPVQEATVTNFHRVLVEYIEAGVEEG
ncbi:MAG: aromatic ring-hydroxylating dioxygenase subunit alpha [Novosphingobium sp.]|nr:aromatic ring-hydroxylating dioxygenase subunit alpha [Novosphingobium sp.]